MDDIAKLVKEFKQEVREKAIDDFVKAIEKGYEGENKSCIYVSLLIIEEIAEQLKGEK